MAKIVNVLGREIPLTDAQAPKMYVVVEVRPADLFTDNGVYVAYGRVDSATDDISRARANLRHCDAGPAGSAFIVRVEDSAVIL